MDAPMAKGTSVVQRIEPIRGTVADVKFDPDKLSFSYLVEYEGEDGAPHSRWFEASEIAAKEMTE